MPQAKIGEGGRVTLPREFLEAAKAEPGTAVRLAVTGPTTLTLTILRPAGQHPEEGTEDERIADDQEDQHEPDAFGDVQNDYDSLPRLTLEELLEQYPIEGPIDLKADREAIYDEMAKDVFGE